MPKNISLSRIFVYSQSNKGYCYSFSDGTTIIFGANTSGKSTIFQTILYAMGINDAYRYLNPLYGNEFTIRLDIQICQKGEIIPVVFIRCDGDLKIKIKDDPCHCFYGISSDNSAEHVRLKDFLRVLFGFNLELYQGTDYKDASIETLWLPYYICQSVGWVSIRKTFDGLDYYRNFRESFIDYCTGIIDLGELKKKDTLEKEIKELQTRLESLEAAKYSNDENHIKLLRSDIMTKECHQYVDSFCKKEKELQKLHKEYTDCCEKLSFLEMRKRVLKSTQDHLNEYHNEGVDICPVCNQQLNDSIASKYNFYQNLNDTNSELSEVKSKMKETSSQINSKRKQIEELSTQIETERRIVRSVVDENNELSFDDWLDGQAQSKLNTIIDKDIEKYQAEIVHKKKTLKSFTTNDEVTNKRKKVTDQFKELFKKYLNELGVKYDSYKNEDRYFDVYKISILPYQGVELLKSLMAYHFAFNKIVEIHNAMPRLPFLLDAVFKEDITDTVKKQILRFMSKNKPSDTQMIFSMADDMNSKISSCWANNEYFANNAELVNIGNSPRGLLKDLPQELKQLVTDTENLQFTHLHR